MFNLRVRSDLIKLPVTQHPTQIIVQLINNALSHGLEHDGHLRIEINKDHESNGVLVNIIDDGRGIDKGGNRPCF
ncbi:MAG: signal transduction histidine kinase [Polaribacter sp.]|jgi:signal transduction histidine kinase